MKSATVTIIDLDSKSMERMRRWEKLDRGVVKCTLEAEEGVEEAEKKVCAEGCAPRNTFCEFCGFALRPPRVMDWSWRWKCRGAGVVVREGKEEPKVNPPRRSVAFTPAWTREPVITLSKHRFKLYLVSAAGAFMYLGTVNGSSWLPGTL